MEKVMKMYGPTGFPDSWSDEVPDHMRHGIIYYLEHGIQPGSFLQAFLEGDLFTAAMRADATNQVHLFSMARWMINNMPAESYGSRENVKEWMKSGGLRGQEEARTKDNSDQRKPAG